MLIYKVLQSNAVKRLLKSKVTKKPDYCRSKIEKLYMLYTLNLLYHFLFLLCLPYESSSYPNVMILTLTVMI